MQEAKDKRQETRDKLLGNDAIMAKSLQHIPTLLSLPNPNINLQIRRIILQLSLHHDSLQLSCQSNLRTTHSDVARKLQIPTTWNTSCMQVFTLHCYQLPATNHQLPTTGLPMLTHRSQAMDTPHKYSNITYPILPPQYPPPTK